MSPGALSLPRILSPADDEAGEGNEDDGVGDGERCLKIERGFTDDMAGANCRQTSRVKETLTQTTQSDQSYGGW